MDALFPDALLEDNANGHVIVLLDGADVVKLESVWQGAHMLMSRRQPCTAPESPAVCVHTADGRRLELSAEEASKVLQDQGVVCAQRSVICTRNAQVDDWNMRLLKRLEKKRSRRWTCPSKDRVAAIDHGSQSSPLLQGMQMIRCRFRYHEHHVLISAHCALLCSPCLLLSVQMKLF